MTWFPFYTVFPIFANMNNPLWVKIVNVYCAYLFFAAYVAYDLFYTSFLIRFVYKLRNQDVKVETSKITVLAAKACCHTIMSMIAIYLYAFNLPYGAIQMNIVIVAAIHIFLNWKNSHYLILCFCGTDKSKVSPFASEPILPLSDSKTPSPSPSPAGVAGAVYNSIRRLSEKMRKQTEPMLPASN